MEQAVENLFGESVGCIRQPLRRENTASAKSNVSHVSASNALGGIPDVSEITWPNLADRRRTPGHNLISATAARREQGFAEWKGGKLAMGEDDAG
jgi:hypothetical protein